MATSSPGEVVTNSPRGRGRGTGRGTVPPPTGLPRGGSADIVTGGTNISPAAQQLSSSVRGRGRGRGGPEGGPGRHSSYVPYEDPSSVSKNPAARPRSNYSSADSPLDSDISKSTPLNGRTNKIGGSNIKSPGTAPVSRRANSDSNLDQPNIPPRSPPVSPRRENLPALPPRSVSNSGGPVPSSGPLSEEQLREKTIQEIYQTEKDYIADLATLIDVFIFPLKTLGGISEQQVYAIFSNVESLLPCNREMLTGLEVVVAGTDSNVTIGGIFTRLASYFKMYSVYCANQQNSLSTVELLMKKNSQFKRNLDVCHSDPRCRGLFLQSFLIKPIQRVCKYPLLLREMMRHTPEDHPDYPALEKAFNAINAVVADINEAQRQAEGLQRILDLQKLIDGVDTLVAPGRKFVKEGELTFYKSPKSKSGEKRTVFFFTDLILLTSKKGEQHYQFKMSVSLDACKLVVFADTQYIKNAFELSQAELKKKCILSGESAQESNQWIKEIRALIKGYQKKQMLIMGK